MEYNIYNIDKNLASINKISQDLITNPKEININKTISELGALLQNLERNVKVGFTPNVEKAMPNIGESLQALRQNFNSFSRNQVNEVHYGKLSEINERIENIEKAVSVQTIFGERFKPIKVVSLIYFCDMDLPDSNGAISKGVKNALNQEVPFIISSSLLQEKGNEVGLNDLNQMRQTLSVQKEKYDIYEQDGMFVFIPIAHLEGKSKEEKLASFDFKLDLKKIEGNPLTIAPKKVTVSTLSNFFIDKPKKDKTFYILGHGNQTRIAALNESQFNQISEFLVSQRCKGLALTTCGGGGSSSKMHVPATPSTEAASYLDQEKPHPFHTIVRSLDDSDPLSNQEAEINFKGFLEVFNQFVESTNIKTAEEFGEQMMAYEGGKEKVSANLIKLYPKQSAGIPGNFQLLNERKEDFSLTISKVRLAELASKKIDPRKETYKIESSPNIVIENKKRLEVFPLVASPPLVFKGQNPILLSMLPGNGHHFIQEIRLSDELVVDEKSNEPYLEGPSDFIRRTLKQQSGRVKKGFFIDKISGENVITNVVIFSSSNSSFGMYKSEEGYNFITSESFQEITAEEYELYTLEASYSSKPENKSIRMASAGLESDADFNEAINAHHLKESTLIKMFMPNTLTPASNFEEVYKELSVKNKTIIAKILMKRMPEFAFNLIMCNKDIIPPIHMIELPNFWIYAAKHGQLNSFMDRIQIEGECFGAIVQANDPILTKLALSKGGHY
jgi:hypothetical protein